MRLLLAAILLTGCAVPVDGELGSAASQAAPNPCNAPVFAPGECRADVVNGGVGPDAYRTICDRGDETWVLYPSGEQWHMHAPDGKTDPVICHGK